MSPKNRAKRSIARTMSVMTTNLSSISLLKYTVDRDTLKIGVAIRIMMPKYTIPEALPVTADSNTLRIS